MKLFDNILKTISSTADQVQKKNHQNANLNRLRTVIRCESAAADREYLALGRYYYNHLRNAENEVAEGHCANLDAIEARIANAQTLVEQVYAGEDPFAPEEEECTCGEHCCGEECTCGEEEAEEVTLEDVQSYDSDPTVEAVTEAAEAVAEEASEDEENDELPFEG